MAINLAPTPVSYPPNSRPTTPTLGLAAGAPALVRIGQMRQAAAIASAKAGGTFAPSFGRMIGQLLSPIGLLKTTGLSALISFPLAAISNFLALQAGNITEKQFLARTVADGAAYTACGTLGSLAGALLGTLIPIPFVGTALGLLGGVLLGSLLGMFYDAQVKPQFQQSVEASMTSAGML